MSISRTVLPLFGSPICAPRRDGARYLEMVQELGANAVIVCVSEEDFRMRRTNVSRLVGMAREAGLYVYLDPWGFGNLMGGEALSSTTMARRLTDQAWYYHDLEGHEVTESPEPQLRHYIELASDSGANALFWDELKVTWPAPRPPTAPTMPVAMFQGLAAYAAARGLLNSLCLPIFGEAEVMQLKAMATLPEVGEIGFTRYYSAGKCNLSPSQYDGPVTAELRRYLDERQLDTRILVWRQGFDLGERHGELIVEGARVARNLGATSVGVWGGPCVDDLPFAVPQELGQHDDQIRRAFALFDGSAAMEPEAA